MLLKQNSPVWRQLLLSHVALPWQTASNSKNEKFDKGIIIKREVCKKEAVMGHTHKNT